MRFVEGEDAFGQPLEDGGNFFITGADVNDAQGNAIDEIEQIAEEKSYGSEANREGSQNDQSLKKDRTQSNLEAEDLNEGQEDDEVFDFGKAKMDFFK